MPKPALGLPRKFYSRGERDKQRLIRIRNDSIGKGRQEFDPQERKAFDRQGGGGKLVDKLVGIHSQSPPHP